MPKVSIILPVYNGGKTIKRCLESLLQQSYSDFEIVVINDGSIDNSLQIISHYASIDSRIRIINKQNEGVSAARNDGLTNAHGKYITFCDADDETNSKWLATMVNNISDTDFVATGIRFIRPDGSSYDKVPTYSEIKKASDCTDLITNLISNEIYGFTWCKLFRKDIIQKNHILFNPEIAFREDELWCVSYFRHIKSWKTIPTANYNYYLPEQGKNYHGNFTDFVIPIFEEYEKLFPSVLPSSIADEYYRMVRNQLVTLIARDQHPDKKLVKIFSDIKKAYTKKRGIISRSVDSFLTKSDKHPVLVKFILSLHKR